MKAYKSIFGGLKMVAKENSEKKISLVTNKPF